MPIDVSIVIPLFEEEESVRPLCEAIRRAMTAAIIDHEVILVDDGSRDRTFLEACSVAENDPRVRVVKLTRNFGQTAALKAGFDQAIGNTIVTMDGDLQNDPRDIPGLLEKIGQGFDLVAGWRAERKDRWLSRRLPSQIANWLVRKATGVPIHDNGCALRVYRADVIKKYPLYSEMHRLLPTILAMTGARIAEVKVSHHPRQYGHSKYGISRAYKVVLDLVALRTILVLYRLPFFGFGAFAALFLIISLSALVLAVWYAGANPDATLVVFVGASILWGVLGVSVLTMGILCDIVYAKADIRIERLLAAWGTVN